MKTDHEHIGSMPSHAITVPFEGNDERQSPLFLSCTFGSEAGLCLKIIGDTSFRNIVGEREYKEHLLQVGTPSALNIARTIEVRPPSRLNQIRAFLGNTLLRK